MDGQGREMVYTADVCIIPMGMTIILRGCLLYSHKQAHDTIYSQEHLENHSKTAYLSCVSVTDEAYIIQLEIIV
jgi:hypothetical protein